MKISHLTIELEDQIGLDSEDTVYFFPHELINMNDLNKDDTKDDTDSGENDGEGAVPKKYYKYFDEIDENEDGILT